MVGGRGRLAWLCAGAAAAVETMAALFCGVAHVAVEDLLPFETREIRATRA
jgi:hypothetical protein